ncbi:MAG: acyl-CoA dehydrogenase [Deltaproteobacteria bacterium]|nr:MAG: acyl-CoA dehydrogenase [Deltaproteobacteria bacterium]
MATPTSAPPVDPEPRAPQGGGFLLEAAGPGSVFTPESLSEEQRLFYKTAQDFVEGEVLPRAKAIESKAPGVLTDLLRQAGDLGLLMVTIPEAYGGLGLGLSTHLLISEAMARLGAWSVTFGAHTGIGTEPILFFGNEAQKRRYLPDLATGRRIAAYALTEPGAGSDALAGRTRAELRADGTTYRLNGSKQWITNGAIADVFVVFAKVDGEHFTAFIVEKGTPGFRVGPEEQKMGLRGSSTTTLHFDDAEVPAENVLYEVGKGHKIAFGVLNVGRLKLGVGATGAAKNLIADAVRYAQERTTFGKPLLAYGMIREKLARMVVLTYASESMAYRTAGLADTAAGDHAPDRMLAALGEYAVESSIVKVFGSEVLDEVVDEDLQIHGGYGYTEDYLVERAYRDARINRIFEGTNEINRLLIPGMLLKRAMRGTLDLMGAVERLEASFAEGQALPHFEGPLAAARRAAEGTRRMTLFLLAQAVQRFGFDLKEEQELLHAIADLCIAAYAIDSNVRRSLAHAGDHPELREALVCFHAAIAWEEAFVRARRSLASFLDGEALTKAVGRLGQLFVWSPFDFKAAEERIVGAAIAAGGYPFPLV